MFFQQTVKYVNDSSDILLLAMEENVPSINRHMTRCE